MRRIVLSTGKQRLLRVSVILAAGLMFWTVALCGCAGLGGQPATTLSVSTAPVTTSVSSASAIKSGSTPNGTSSAGASSGSASASSSASKTGRPRPSAVTAVFGSIPGPPPCLWVAADTYTTEFTVAELDTLFVCFSGLDPSSSPTLQVVTPSGATRTIEDFSASDSRQWKLNPDLGNGPVDTLGRYSFELVDPAPGESNSSSPSAETSLSVGPTPIGFHPTIRPQSTLVASGHFTVTQLTKPEAENPAENPLIPVPLGQPLTASLAGFPANSSVLVSLYGPGPRDSLTFPLFLDLPTLTTNASGEAFFQWIVPSGTPAGYYGIVIDPPPVSCSLVKGCLPYVIGS